MCQRVRPFFNTTHILLKTWSGREREREGEIWENVPVIGVECRELRRPPTAITVRSDGRERETIAD